jgi:RecA/RadA recombinase
MAQSKAIQQVVPVVEQPLQERRQPATTPEPRKRKRAPARARKGGKAQPLQPRELGAVLDDALVRMRRRAEGKEKAIPLPWRGLAEALGGGFWAGTSVTLVGDTGCGKTQWALQVALHAAASGIPVCYVASEPGVDQVAPRLLAIKAGHRWSDLYVGKTDPATLETIRRDYTDTLKGLPFHLLPGKASRPGEPGSRAVAEWMRDRYKETAPGSRPILVVQDFVELVSGAGRDQEEFNELMGRVAQEARQAAREHDATVLIVSSTSREQRLNDEGSIGIHHERRQPRGLGRGNPARLLLTGKNAGDLERESDTVLVLAAEPEPRPAGVRADEERKWSRVWCAVAKNRSGGRAWCALRFNGNAYEEDEEATRTLSPESCDMADGEEE